MVQRDHLFHELLNLTIIAVVFHEKHRLFAGIIWEKINLGTGETQMPIVPVCLGRRDEVKQSNRSNKNRKSPSLSFGKIQRQHQIEDRWWWWWLENMENQCSIKCSSGVKHHHFRSDATAAAMGWQREDSVKEQKQ